MRAAVLCLFVAACTFEWNDDQPAFPLTGDPPPLSAFQKLNSAPASRASLLYGPDGAPWATFCEFWSSGTANNALRNCKRLHLVRVGGCGLPACERRDFTAEEFIDGDAFSLHGQELYIIRDAVDATMRTVTLHRPGDPASADVSFTFPSGGAILYPSDSAEVFVYWVVDPSTTEFGVYRRDRKYQRMIPVPAGVDPAAPGNAAGFEFLLTADGSVLVLREPSGQMTAYSTTDASQVSLGQRPDQFVIDDDHRAVLTIGSDGFQQVPLDGGPARMLSPLDFDPGNLVLTSGQAFFAENGLWQVPLDGSGPALLAAPSGARLWALGPQGEILYSRDDRNRYAGGAGDGWLGDWQFMERGRIVRWNADGSRIHFLEHAATIGTYGDLTSVRVPRGAPELLGKNVHSFAELADGRVLAVENAVYAGNWNRLVIIDEAAHTKHWVVPQTVDFILLPAGDEIVADVVTGASGYDIVRARVP